MGVFVPGPYIKDNTRPPYKYQDKDGNSVSKPIEESPDGVDSVEAFFMISERGKAPEKVTNLARLSYLLYGQRWLAAHEKMYREGFEEGTLLLSDFEDEPDYVKEFINKIWINFLKHYKPGKSLFTREVFNNLVKHDEPD